MRSCILLCLLVFVIQAVAKKPGRKGPPTEDTSKYKTIAFKDELHPQKAFEPMDLFSFPSPPKKKHAPKPSHKTTNRKARPAPKRRHNPKHQPKRRG